MSILIQCDKENQQSIDYFFMCDVYAPDPRYKSRFMCVGQRRGLFRIQKESLSTELLAPMELDEEQKRFERAAGKVIRQYRANSSFPQATQFASG